MSEKKRFRIGEAVVNLSSMNIKLAEVVVASADAALRCVPLWRRDALQRRRAALRSALRRGAALRQHRVAAGAAASRLVPLTCTGGMRCMRAMTLPSYAPASTQLAVRPAPHHADDTRRQSLSQPFPRCPRLSIRPSFAARRENMTEQEMATGL